MARINSILIVFFTALLSDLILLWYKGIELTKQDLIPTILFSIVITFIFDKFLKKENEKTI